MQAKELPCELLKLIHHGENDQIEYIEIGDQIPSLVYETISAFSNRNGGDLFLGVNDQGVILGIDPCRIEQIQNEIYATIHNEEVFSPILILMIEVYVYSADGSYKSPELKISEEAGEHYIIRLRIPQTSYVVRYNHKIYDRHVFLSVDITNYDYRVFQCYLRKQRVSFVEQVFPNFKISDLRKDLIDRARQSAKLKYGKDHAWVELDDQQLLRSARLILPNEQGKFEVTLACILLFGTDQMIASVCSHHKTDCIVKLGNQELYDDRDVICTNLLDSYDRMMEFGEKYFNIDVKVKNTLLHEIVTNSLIHRDYSNLYGAKMLIEKDSLLLENANIALSSEALTLEELHPCSKNPTLAKVFREMGYANELGTGLSFCEKFSNSSSNVKSKFIEGDFFKTIISLS